MKPALTTARASRLHFRFATHLYNSSLGGIPMRRSFALTPVFIAFVFAATLAHAQSAVLDLPRDSQHARVIQRVGITDITINYHRPLVKGRKVWAALCLTARCGAQAQMKTPRSNSPIQ